MSQNERPPNSNSDFEAALRRIEALERAIARLGIVRGEVAANGSINLGKGFSVSKIGTGVYTVTFDNAFVLVPVVELSPGNTSSAIGVRRAVATDSRSFTAVTFLTTTGATQDSEFDFIAIPV